MKDSSGFSKINNNKSKLSFSPIFSEAKGKVLKPELNRYFFKYWTHVIFYTPCLRLNNQ